LARVGSVREATAVNALRGFASEPARGGIFLDVDGTLAPIVADPPHSPVPHTTRRAPEPLAPPYALSACVDGPLCDRGRDVAGGPLRRRARRRARPGGGDVGAAHPRVRRRGRLAGGGQAALGRVPLPHRGGPRGGAARARGRRARRARAGLPDALGPARARGA